MAVIAEKHCRHLLKQLNEQRLSKEASKFCDIEVKIKDTSFKAHTSVLASFSKYFQNIKCEDEKLSNIKKEIREDVESDDEKLKNSDTEQKLQTITLPGITPKQFQGILEFIYTGDVVLTKENVKEILVASTLLQVDGLRSACTKFIVKKIQTSHRHVNKEITERLLEKDQNKRNHPVSVTWCNAPRTVTSLHQRALVTSHKSPKEIKEILCEGNRDCKPFQENWSGKPSNKLPRSLKTRDGNPMVGRSQDKAAVIEPELKTTNCLRNNGSRLSSISRNTIGEIRGLKRQWNDRSTESVTNETLSKRQCPQNYFQQQRIPRSKYARTTSEMLAQHHICMKPSESYQVPGNYFPQLPLLLQNAPRRINPLDGAVPIHNAPSSFAQESLYPTHKNVLAWQNHYSQGAYLLPHHLNFEQFQPPQNYIIAPIPHRVHLPQDVSMEDMPKKPHLHRRKTKLLSSLKYNKTENKGFQPSPGFDGKYEASGEESDDSGRPSST